MASNYRWAELGQAEARRQELFPAGPGAQSLGLFPIEFLVRLLGSQIRSGAVGPELAPM